MIGAKVVSPNDSVARDLVMATTTTAATPTPKDISWHHKDSKFLGVADMYDLYGGGPVAAAA